jgi:glycosyltransferase involved in cell wall biosynthesis
MKIVHVTSSLVRKSAGVREVVLGLARAQGAIGLDVAVLGLDHPDWKDELSEWDGIPTKVLPVRGPRRFGYAPKIVDVLYDMQPDIVHLHGLWMHHGRSVLQWHRATGKPYMLSPHGMLSDVALTYGRPKKKLVSLWFQNAVFRNAAVLHATSDAEVSEFRAYGLHSPVCVVPNGINEIARPIGTAEPSRTILSLGRVHRKKALDQLILAWQKLEPGFPDWSVQIVGPDEKGETARLSALVEETGVARVAFRGPVYGDEKVSIMASAGVFALPTRSENFALTVAESLMLGVPVVSSKGAPWSGLKTEGCGLWVPFGADDMAEGLRKLMSLSDEERQAMGARGRDWMLREFSWSSVAERLHQHYIKAVEVAP